jgi:hypothetical protein
MYRPAIAAPTDAQVFEKVRELRELCTREEQSAEDVFSKVVPSRSAKAID